MNLAVYKTLTFGISAAFAGVAGSLLMIETPQATDTKFGLDLAIFLVVALVIGGVATIWGAIPGALVFVFIPYYTRRSGATTSASSRDAPAPAPSRGVFYGACCWSSSSSCPAASWTGIRRVKARLVKVIPNPSWLPEHHAEIIVQ